MKDKRLYHSVAQKISRLIEEGKYPPGSRLPGERELAEHFKVSRVTIREAEISLQSLGLIDIRTGAGVYVLDASSQRNGRLPDVSAFEVTEARSLFESEAAALAAPDISDATLTRLADLIDRMASNDPADESMAERADRDFHLAIAAASGNGVVLHIVESLWKMRTELPLVKAVYDSVCLGDAALRGDEHAEILDALRQRNPVAARAAMRKHFTRLLESMLDVTEQQAVREVRQKANESRRRFLKTAQM